MPVGSKVIYIHKHGSSRRARAHINSHKGGIPRLLPHTDMPISTAAEEDFYAQHIKQYTSRGKVDYRGLANAFNKAFYEQLADQNLMALLKNNPAAASSRVIHSKSPKHIREHHQRIITAARVRENIMFNAALASAPAAQGSLFSWLHGSAAEGAAEGAEGVAAAAAASAAAPATGPSTRPRLEQAGPTAATPRVEGADPCSAPVAGPSAAEPGDAEEQGRGQAGCCRWHARGGGGWSRARLWRPDGCCCILAPSCWQGPLAVQEGTGGWGGAASSQEAGCQGDEVQCLHAEAWGGEA